MTLLKGFDLNNDLAKLFEEKIPPIKQKNIIKDQEVVCEDLSVFLNAWRDNKKTQYHTSIDYNSNIGSNSIDDKGKKKLDLLQGIRKQDYSSNTISLSSNTNVNGANPYDSTDNKTKNDFQKFLGMNANKTSDTSSTGLLNKQTTLTSSALNSLKGKPTGDIKVILKII